jgi:16S rRNA (uracil1498-N3)-methyltransferase
MPTFIVKNNPGLQKPVQLSEDDEKHIVKSLRMRIGEKIQVTDHEGHIATAGIISLSPLQFSLENVHQGPAPVPLTVALPWIETKRLEWAVEKLTELNVKTIQLLITERTETKKIKDSKIEKLKRVGESASKQSGRCYPIEILNPVSLHEIQFHDYDFVFHGDIPDTDDAANAFQSEINFEKGLFLIGPEGGLTEKEREFLKSQNSQPISLSETVLRTETAAVVGAATIIPFFS